MMYPSEPRYAAAMAQTSKELTESLLDILTQFQDASPEIMIEALEPTLALAQEYVPFDTGELYNSAYLEDTSTKTIPRVEIGYARRGRPYYAMYVHEMVHIPHQAPTRAKWLQAAVMEDLDNIRQRLEHGYVLFMRGAR